MDRANFLLFSGTTVEDASGMQRVKTELEALGCNAMVMTLENVGEPPWHGGATWTGYLEGIRRCIREAAENFQGPVAPIGHSIAGNAVLCAAMEEEFENQGDGLISGIGMLSPAYRLRSINLLSLLTCATWATTPLWLSLIHI